MKRRYKGLFGLYARRRCPHSGLIGIYGDEVNNVGGYRLYCEDCDRFLGGPVLLAVSRYEERGTREGIQSVVLGKTIMVEETQTTSWSDICNKLRRN